MSIINHLSKEDQLDLVCEIVSRLKPKVYLELGVKKGNTISSISSYAKRSIGVDIHNPSKIKGYEFYNMTTDQFFEKVKNKEIDLLYVDAAFIDANHSRESVLKDFYNVWSILRDNGIIILHDTYPKDKIFVDEKLCGDAYLAAWEISLKDIPMIEYFTLPVHPGLTFIRKREYQVLWGR
jgi:hypothetical protein